MRIPWTLLWVLGLFGVLGLAPAPALAQTVPPRVISSVDVMVLSQDRVVVGKIARVLASDNNSTDVAITVDEVLKGESPATLQLHQERFRGGRLTTDELSRMAGRNARVLVIGNGLAPLDGGELAIPTAGGTLLNDANAVIAYIREVLRNHPGGAPVESFTISPPKQLATVTVSGLFDNGMLSPSTMLSVPVDAQLEKWALEAIRSKQEYSNGLSALRFFKTDPNIAFVKELLEDSTFVVLGSAENNNGIEVRYYPIRQDAYNLLRNWGVAVDRPIVVESLSSYATLQTQQSGTKLVTILSLIDGSDVLKIRGNELWFEHRNYVLPGQWVDHNNASGNEPTYINSEAWVPRWSGTVSVRYAAKARLLPEGSQVEARLVTPQDRGSVTILEQPSAQNNFTLSILLDDDFALGAAWYQVEVRLK